MWLILQDYDDNPRGHSLSYLREQFRKSLMKMLHRIYNRLSNFEKISRSALEKICGPHICFLLCFSFGTVIGLLDSALYCYRTTCQSAASCQLTLKSGQLRMQLFCLKAKPFLKLAILYPIRYHLNKCLYDLCVVPNPLAGIFLEVYYGSRGQDVQPDCFEAKDEKECLIAPVN